MEKWAKILGGAGIAMIIMALIVVCMGMGHDVKDPDNNMIDYLNDIGFQAFIFFGVLVGCNGVWLWSNAHSDKQDPKALPIDLKLFQTDKGYTYGALGIAVITMILYALLW